MKKATRIYLFKTTTKIPTKERSIRTAIIENNILAESWTESHLIHEMATTTSLREE